MRAQAARRAVGAVQDVGLNPIAFVTANYVARETGWAMHGWGHGDRETNDAFRPLETYGERLDELLGDVRGLGFDTIDLWGAHLHPDWATRRARRNRAGAPREARPARLVVRRLGGPGHDRARVRARDRGRHERHRRRRYPATCARSSPRCGSTASRSRSRTIPRGRPGRCSTRSSRARGRSPRRSTPAGGRRRVTTRCGRSRSSASTSAHVHLKDVRAVGEPHETCRWGEGIVDVRGLRARAPRGGVRGHAHGRARARGPRPERRVPGDARRAERVAAMRVALVGCGNIAARYAKAINAEPRLELGGATDVDPGRAAELVGEFGGREYASLDALLADDEIDTVVNLTAPQAHAEVSARSLEAGKHVHTEKPVALAYEEARGLAELADAARRQAELRAGDAARRGAADGVEARSRRRDRHGARGLRRGELGPDRDVAPVAAGPVRRRAGRRRRHLPADDPDGDVRAGPARRRLRHDARACPRDARRRAVQPRGAGSQRRARRARVGRRRPADRDLLGRSARQRGIEFHGESSSLYLASWMEFDSPSSSPPTARRPRRCRTCARRTRGSTGAGRSSTSPRRWRRGGRTGERAPRCARGRSARRDRRLGSGGRPRRGAVHVRAAGAAGVGDVRSFARPAGST